MEHDKITQEKIAIDQVQRLTDQAMLGLSATALNSIIVAVVLISAVPRHKVLLWLSISLTVSLIRILLQIRFRHRPLRSGQVDRRKATLLIALTVSGCVWGSIPLYLFPHSSIGHQVFIVMVLGGMVAGAVGTFASIMATFYAFCIPAVTPLIIVLFILGDGLHTAMASLLVIFGYLMFTAARRLNREIYNFLAIKYEKIDLIANLENEIKERQIAEEKLKSKNQQIESIVEKRTSELRRVNAKLLVEIEDRIEAEKAARESEEKYRHLADSLPQIVFETDARGTITFANSNAYDLLEYSKEDFEAGISAFQILTAVNKSDVHEKFHSILEGEKLEGYEFFARTKSGRKFPVDIHSAPVMHSGRSVGIRGIIIDLTEKKRVEEEQRKLESQLQRAQKMEVLGTMAGGVAHDLNNILSGIVGYPDLLLMQIPTDSALRKPIQVMQESGKKAAAIVQDLLTLTRRGVLVEEVLDLNQCIREYLDSPEHEKLMSFHPAVEVASSLDANLLNIAGSRVHLVKAVMNLVSNAAEAMPKGGTIRIATTNRYLDQPIKGYDDIEEGDYVVLTVSDCGIGIASGDIDRIFEPFFTKKIMGRSGTGLGMAVVWGTVKDHKGYIDVNSVEGQGSQFSLYFPVTRRSRADTRTEEPAAVYAGNGESVLVVDDISEQRQIASDMLRGLNYKVESVSSGEEAVAYLTTNRADVVILDMIMDPGMDGLDTYKKILELHPAQKAVIASGYSETDRVREAIRLGAGPYIKKPYTWLKMARSVKAALP